MENTPPEGKLPRGAYFLIHPNSGHSFFQSCSELDITISRVVLTAYNFNTFPLYKKTMVLATKVLIESHIIQVSKASVSTKYSQLFTWVGNDRNWV